MKRLLLLVLGVLFTSNLTAQLTVQYQFQTYVGRTGGTQQTYYFTVPAGKVATVMTEVRNLEYRIVMTNTTYSVYSEVPKSPFEQYKNNDLPPYEIGSENWLAQIRALAPVYKSTPVSALNTGSYYVYDGFANSLLFHASGESIGSQIGSIQVQPGPGTGTYWGGSGYNYATYDLPPGDYAIIQHVEVGAFSNTLVIW